MVLTASPAVAPRPFSRSFPNSVWERNAALETLFPLNFYPQGSLANKGTEFHAAMGVPKQSLGTSGKTVGHLLG